MGKIQKQVSLLSLTVEPGTTERVLCPACRGGSTGELSLALTKDPTGVVLYKCHRASCEVSGKVGGVGGVPTPRPTRLRPYTGSLRCLTQSEYDFLREKFGLIPASMPGIRYSDETQRFMLPVMSPNYELRGWVGRSFSREPKALTFIHRDEPFQGWVSTRKTAGPVIVVEDYFSACKVAKAGYIGVFLNGVHISPDGALELSGVDHLILALDDGTLPQMLKLKARYGHLWRSIILWQLDKDLKYVEPDEIRQAVENGKTTFKCSDKGTLGVRGDLLSDQAGQFKSSRAASFRVSQGLLRARRRGSVGGEGRPSEAGGGEGTQPEAG